MTHTMALIFCCSSLLAQGPPNPPGDPSTGGGPVGGSAPLGEGIAVMLAAASFWAGKKIFRYYRQEHKQQLEE